MRRPCFLTVLLGVATVFGACGATSRNAPPPGKPPSGSPAENSDAIADFLTHHRYHHHGGFLMLVTMSLDTLGLDSDQQARVEALRSDLLSKMEPAREAERQVVELLVTGVAQSFIDKAKVDAAIATLGNAAAAVHDATIDDLNRLHDVLTPSEREALVEKADSHWRLWKMANAYGKEGGGALGKEIGLTPLQQDQVRKDYDARTASQALHEREVERHLNDFGRAFRSDKFDAAQLKEASFANRHMAEWGASRLALYCEVVNPVLTPEQRNKFVSILREHLTHDERQAGD
jgi:Spy/CpxP family protein refolding chaperone